MAQESSSTIDKVRLAKRGESICVDNTLFWFKYDLHKGDSAALLVDDQDVTHEIPVCFLTSNASMLKTLVGRY